MVGNRRFKTTYQAVTRIPTTRGPVLPRGRNMQDMPMPRSYHHSYFSSLYGYRRHQMSTYGNQPQRCSHLVRAPPGHMWYLPRWYPNTSNTGRCGGEESYWLKGCQVPPKAKSVKIGAPIVQAPQLTVPHLLWWHA